MITVTDSTTASANSSSGTTDRTTPIYRYTTKPTKRAIPAMAVRIASLADAQAAAQGASAAPRLDVV
ncbi:MAG: hypothetical protein ACRDTG_17660 [Pseudonocardiaceae bacterium]